jgi:hypothetical protein
LNMNWDSQSWKKSTKILLGIVTIWPFLYIGLFVLIMFSMMLFLSREEKRSNRNCGNVDLLQLDHKIENGDIKELTLTPREIIAVDRIGDCQFTVSVTNRSTRDEIVSKAREVVNGQPRVATIKDKSTAEEEVPALVPLGFFGLFAVHMISVVIMMALLPLYIVLAVKNKGLDETMKIVWVVLLATLGLLVNPVYWYLYVWKNRSASTQVAPASPVDIPSVS